MKRRIGLVGTCVIGAFLSTTALVLPGVQAQAADFPVKAAEPVPYWWFHGTIEAGGRIFLNDPQRNGSAYLNKNSLAKYYEYSKIAPGPFSNIELATGSKDGLYQIEVGGKNIGYGDQSYYLDLSKAGEHYLSLGWDQSPHLYSTSAQTPYLGVGTDTLTIPTASKAAAVSGVTGFNQTDIGIKRDTASVEYRWTPTDAWDIKADLSHLRRTGTQVDGVNNGFSAAYQVPKPVKDTTQNYGLNGEYAGTSPWGKKLTFKVGYNGSQYTDDYAAYTVQSPLTGSTQLFRESLPPSNNANAFSGTLGADLPWKSRYVSTLSYTMMRQDAAFIPESTGANPAALLPASSLNGAINTLLSNNVLTSKITSDLTSKLSYRYYNFQNNTPEILIPRWTSYDQSNAAGTEGTIRSLSTAYIKQNAGADLNWRPSREWNLGAAYGYERYNWTRADVDATNEHSGKVHADWKPDDWLTVRSSGYYGNRRYENYDYADFVRNIQFPTISGYTATSSSWYYQDSYRQLMIDNRQTWKANLAIDMVIFPTVTLTPTLKYKDENYSVNPKNDQGLEDSRSWSAGLDATYVINPDTSVMVGYMREYYTQLLFSCDTNAVTHGHNCAPFFPAQQTSDKTVVDTFTALVRYAAIPDKLDTELRYTLSRGVDTTNLFTPINATGLPTTGQFPDYTTWFQRLDATAVYTFDKAAVAQLGGKGVVKAKLHYVWERNSVSNWANDPVAPYNTWASSALWMASDNPNYNVHMLMASLAYTW